MEPNLAISLGGTAARILVITGLVQILWGLVTGLPMGLLRIKGDEVPRYLTLAHMGGLMQGPLVMSLVFVTHLSALPDGWETLAAGAIAIASLLLVIKDTLNWWTGVGDEFAERPPGYYLGVILGPLYLFGMIVLTIGVGAALLG